MKTLFICFCLLALSAPLLSATANAQERYISDVLHVPLRSGMGNQFRIVHQGIRSGTQVELLEQGETADGESWSLVRTPNGTEGWMRTQFLLEEPTAALRLERAEQRASNAATQAQTLRENLQESRQAISQLEGDLEQVREDYATLQEEHEEIQAISADALGLHEQHQELSESYQMLQTRHEVIQAENERLRLEQRYRDWLFGGGILVAGIILSLILQALGRRRRQSEWR